LTNEAVPPLYVTKPWLPPLEELTPYFEQIWSSKILSNMGPLHQRFEREVAEYLGVKHISVVANATIALVLALRRFKMKGEVITTPFSFVATANSIVEAGLKPVFVDVLPGTYALDPAQIEANITPETCAIMPVHCFGYGCDTGAIDAIAKKHNLKVIYDAAHAFGIRDQGGSILRHGNASILSFHATKVFTTFEGGAIISETEEDKREVDRLTNFGFNGDIVDEVGTNAKMSELGAAVGLVLLKHIDTLIAERGKRDAIYRELLRDVPGIKALDWPAGQTRNYYNFPVLVEDSFPVRCEELVERMKERGVFGRRYFYPLLPDFPIHKDARGARAPLPVARDVASRIMCLPLHPTLTLEEQQRVVDSIRRVL